ncbi:MAG: primosomal protein N' [Bacteroidaceae bacterium]|nr:primosomal protein N' [Bacteroidaceae bacterium]
MKYADVILPLPLNDTFTYALPQEIAVQVKTGCRLIVPFGNRKFYSGIVVRLHDTPPGFAVKDAFELLDAHPVLLPTQMALWKWIAEYYLCTMGDVYNAALPTGMKLESETSVTLCPDYAFDQKLSLTEERILQAIGESDGEKIAALQKATGIRHILPHVNHLLQKGILLIKEEVRRTYKPKTLSYVRVTEKFFDEKTFEDFLKTLKNCAAQKKLLVAYTELSGFSVALALQNMQLLKEISRAELLEKAGASAQILKALCEKGCLQLYEKHIERIPHNDLPESIMLPQLSEAQQKALEGIQHEWEKLPTCLLHGVTGSGKTEIYIHLISQALKEGKQVLYLLPEIVLTVQLTQRLKRVFGDRLGIYHSRYSDAERVEIYQKMLSDEPYDIIVGVRSSLFLPFKHLGLVIVDEEHETSFKQQDPAPRYHARNAALVLAHQCKAKTLLGTATPSLESYYNALHGKYGLVKLCTRFRDARLPQVEVVDIRELRRKKRMSGPFSPRLLELMREALEQHKQIILFQNRRGYAPMMECHTCGWVPKCNNCDVSLHIHKGIRALTCHYCGAVYPMPDKCPNCESTTLRTQGYGTERIEDEIRQIFPEARIARMDLDTTRSRQSYERIIADFQKGYTDILVGTQMVSKGLDFQHVSVVGILNANTMLCQPDFRSYERAFQMMAQVAGRAGRHGAQGYVVLQTTDAEVPTIGQVTSHDYEGMYAEQILERELFQYPPHCRLIYIYMKHRKEETVQQLAQDTATFLRRIFDKRVLGPDTPPVGRIQNMFIRKIILKVELNAPLNEARKRLKQLQAYLLEQPKYKSAQFYFDVD